MNVSTMTVQTRGGARSRFMAVLSYLGILCFVPLIRNHGDEFVYFHARQGLVIWMWGVLAIVALHIPGIGKWLFNISLLAVVIYSIIGIISASLNRAWKLPIVYSLSNRI